MATFNYKYGAYTHETGSVTDFVWEHIPNITKRGQRDIALYRVTLRGMFLCTTGDDWTDIRDKISTFQNAYNNPTTPYFNNDLKFALVNPDGTDSKYVLDPATDPWILKGPYLKRVIYPTGTIEEMVAKREWEVVLECLRLEPESEIIHYEETIRHFGNCAKSWVAQLTQGVVRSYRTHPATTQMIVQSGNSVGLEGYYLPGWNAFMVTLGIPVLDTSYEHEERRVETLGKPLRFQIPRIAGRNKFLYYPAEWTYVFESQIPLLIPPV